jgi:hypothetical protein
VAAESEILLESRGLKVVGQPFPMPNAIGFDEVWQWERRVYDLSGDGKQTLTRSQRSHSVTRFSITLKSDVWLVDGTILTNGVHDVIGKPSFSGVIKWHPDGFEFVGMKGVDNYYAAAGKYILGIGHGSVRYIRDGDTLRIKQSIQGYRLSTGPDGSVLIAPDFQRPIGSPFVSDTASEPPKKGQK